eukprot:CAMPEP_0114271358 /NCGR_PEP_ID=MMETSP0058-20121206/27802_1 /TAXON_ID=36894 /ORGANISM="Pyramimonas parkeae, CCMP726" /LENGTH=76 /DNA_ID=CAMNT_0001390303 /DNA_START=1020 /DNA_END=1248 /DNA_ORIENTATION=-
MTTSHALRAGTHAGDGGGYAAVGDLLQVGFGPISWLMISKIFPLRVSRDVPRGRVHRQLREQHPGGGGLARDVLCF